MYQRIEELPKDFADAEANSVSSLQSAWLEQRATLAESGALETFNNRLTRRWSIETGIIERLYSLDRGTTEILITHGLDAALVEHGSSDLPALELVSILKDHEEAVSYIFDHVTHTRPLTEHFVRSLHSVLTKSQEYVEVESQFGARFKTALLRGTWKTVPNNPRRPNGEIHEYCPPHLVEEEMARLIGAYERLVESKVPTVIRAAWLHHRFTQIHPFQDGNGRVARALTAMVFVADDGFPIVVDRDIRDQYIQSLEAADAGEIRNLVRLFSLLEKREIEEALSLAEDSLALANKRHGGTLREKLLAAMANRARERRQAITANRRRVIDIGVSVFDKEIVPEVSRLRTEMDVALSEALPGSSTKVDTMQEGEEHYFKYQVVEIAKKEGYFCDLETFHRWVRLKIRRPNEQEDDNSEIVISMHSLGRQFTGVLAISAYFAERVKSEDRTTTITLEPKRLAERSLSFSYFESSSNVEERVREWLEMALNMGLAEFQKIL